MVNILLIRFALNFLKRCFLPYIIAKKKEKSKYSVFSISGFLNLNIFLHLIQNFLPKGGKYSFKIDNGHY